MGNNENTILISKNIIPTSKVTYKELKKVFDDTLDKGASFCAIVVQYLDGEQIRTEIGVPYQLHDDTIEIGTYFKDILTAPPEDYHKRKKEIPIDNMVGFRRIELSDICKSRR